MTDDDLDCEDITVGPIRVQVIEPLQTVRLLVSSAEHGFEVDCVFTSRFNPHMEPPFTNELKRVGVFNYERLTQLVTWTGSMKVKDTHYTLDSWFGTRDRSWGFRPHSTADRSKGANQIRNFLANLTKRFVKGDTAPQFYWLWCPLHLAKSGVLYHSQENAKGDPTNAASVVLDQQAGPGPHVYEAGHHVHYETNTRHARHTTITLKQKDGNECDTITIECVPLYPFFMQGVGYNHPVYGHGMRQPHAVTVYDSIECSAVDRAAPLAWHIQEVCKLTTRWATSGRVEEGVGVVEQLCIGPHEPSGFTALYDA